MNAIAGIRMKRLAHPGGFIKHVIIDPLGLLVTRAADVLGVTRAEKIEVSTFQRGGRKARDGGLRREFWLGAKPQHDHPPSYLGI